LRRLGRLVTEAIDEFLDALDSSSCRRRLAQALDWLRAAFGKLV
jgi:hypothetical protein